LNVLNEIIAKLTQNEKLIGIGAAVVAVAWVLGVIITDSWYSASGAQTMGMIAVVAAVAAVVVLYLKYAPNQNITWPAPLTVIFLGIAAVAGVVALIGLLQAFTYDPFKGLGGLASQYGVGKPVTIYLAAGGVAVGAGLMVYAAYMDWNAAKTAA
jgi:amino acid transporter